MKKRLLFLMLVPAFGLASCSNSGPSVDFKKVSYLSVNNTAYVNEDGSAITYYDFATYKFSDADYAEITSYLAEGVTLPKEVTILYDSTTVYGINGTSNKHYLHPNANLTMYVAGLFSKNYSLALKKDSEASYKSYQEYYYSEAKRTIKSVMHENVKDDTSKTSYTSAYRTYSASLNVYLEGKDGKIEKYEAQSPLINLNERSYERYAVISDNYAVTVAYEEEKK